MNTLISILSVIAPVFAIIVLGYGAARFGLVNERGSKMISRFVFDVAIPSLLFRTMASISAPDASPWALWAAYFGGAALSGALAAGVVRGFVGRRAAETSIAGLASGYSNTVLLGLPLIFSFFGQTQAAVPLFIIISINLPVMTLVGTLFVEWSSADGEGGWARVLLKAGRAILTNPIVIGLLGGLAYRLTGYGLAVPVDFVLGWLAWIAVPAALFAMGLALNRFGFTGDVATSSVILACKLVVHPAIVWLMASMLFGLPEIWVAVAVLFAACPTGINVFLFASRYDVAVPAVSAAITVGTAISALSITLISWGLGLQGG
jgi:hypothetical protein